MKANDKFLSIPPYLSTSWRNVLSLSIQDQNLLVVCLRGGHSVQVPGLPTQDIERVFKAHEAYLEQEAEASPVAELGRGLFGGVLGGVSEEGTPFRVSSWEGIFHHNPAQANSPQLPPEILEKVAIVAKMMAADERTVLPKPEPSCHCFHCQVARAVQEAIHPQEEAKEAEREIEIAPADLHFSEWHIGQIGERLFSVTHKLDATEHYTVFLGEPVGCTCGQLGCEHILAVLRS